MPELIDDSRAASSAIEGYLYQIYVTLEKWINLEEGEYLRCEGDEDLDVILTSGEIRSYALKKLSRATNLKDAPLLKTFLKFLVGHTKVRSNNDSRKFIFITTATRRLQRGKRDLLHLIDRYHEGDTVAGDTLIRHLKPIISQGVEMTPRFRAALKSSLAWLDHDSTRWYDFLDSVQFEFSATSMDEIKSRIIGNAMIGLQGPSEHIVSYLVGRVLEVSAKKNPAQRVLSRRLLIDILNKYSDELESWLKTPEAANIREMVEEFGGDRRLSRWLDPGVESLPDFRALSPAILLTPRYEVVPFDSIERHVEIEQLESLVERDVVIILATGVGGTGKTRLAQEWCRRLRANNWHAGFLYRNLNLDEIERIGEGVLPRFIVVDYAETRPRQVERLIRVASRRKSKSPRLHLFLIARKPGDWWEKLKTSPGTEGILAQAGVEMAVSERPRSADDVFLSALVAMGRVLGIDAVPVRHVNKLPESFLLIHLAALLYLISGGEAPGLDMLVERVLEHEYSFWRKQIDSLENIPEPWSEHIFNAMCRTMALATLWGGLPSQAVAKKIAIRLAPESSKLGLLDTSLKLLARLYGSNRSFVSPLEPDLLGEQHAASQILIAEKVLAIAIKLGSAEQRRQTLTVLVRDASRSPSHEHIILSALRSNFELMAETAVEVAVETGEPIGRLLAGELEHRGSPELINRLDELLGGKFGRASSLLDVTLVIRRRRAELSPANMLRYCEALHDLARYSEAEVKLREFIGIFSTESNADADTNRLLAVARRLLGICLWRQQRFKESVLPLADSVAGLRSLNQSDKQVQLDLASSAAAYGFRLAMLGNSEQGVALAQESVRIRRRLVGDGHFKYSSLVMAQGLQNLALAQNKHGVFKEAVLTGSEAVMIFRELAANHPGQFRHDLGNALLDYVTFLVEANESECAMAASMEAISIYRALFAERPAVYCSNLASVLGNHATLLINGPGGSEATNLREALEFVNEAIRVLSAALVDNSPQYRDDLARCIHTRGVILVLLGRWDAAIAGIQEAIKIRRLYDLDDAPENRRLLRLLDLARKREPISVEKLAVLLSGP